MNVTNVRQVAQTINMTHLRYDEPMALHTSFQIGGPADVYLRPAGEAELLEAHTRFSEAGVPMFFLGAGANILVADKGIRGAVLDLADLTEIRVEGATLVAQAGAAMSDVSAAAADASLTGLEWVYGMPGSVGGSVWMNARCYDVSMGDVLSSVEVWDTRRRIINLEPGMFSYKKSPFQSMRAVILSARFALEPGDSTGSWADMRRHKEDRTAKGHYEAPCAGSMFKNNRDFGAPSGKIIDALGFRGKSLGGARVSPHHANIVINAGGATAAEVRRLVEEIQEKVLNTYGFELEPEVLFVGEW